jgi:predicted NAD-dependent protein-ADP-ribosyltransferase YbiA (DUF1768 family)
MIDFFYRSLTDCGCFLTFFKKPFSFCGAKHFYEKMAEFLLKIMPFLKPY